MFATGPRTVGFTIVLGGWVVTMQMTRPKGSSAQWLPPAPPSTLRQLLACNVASGSSFGTGRDRREGPQYAHPCRIVLDPCHLLPGCRTEETRNQGKCASAAA